MKTFIIRREDYFKANGAYLMGCRVLSVGSLWMTVVMTEEQQRAYRYQIAQAK